MQVFSGYVNFHGKKLLERYSLYWGVFFTGTAKVGRDETGTRSGPPSTAVRRGPGGLALSCEPRRRAGPGRGGAACEAAWRAVSVA
jgi:hypothetical protein